MIVKLTPYRKLKIKRTGVEIIVGLLAKDDKANVFGITSSLNFDQSKKAVVLNPKGEDLFRFDAASDRNAALHDDLFVVLSLTGSQNTSLLIDRTAFWPRDVMTPSECIGQKIVDPYNPEISGWGHVTAIRTSQMLGLAKGNQELILVQPFEASTKLIGGTPLMSPAGALAGITIGKIGEQYIILPAHSILSSQDLKLFVPQLSHWTSTDHLLNGLESRLSLAFHPHLNSPPPAETILLRRRVT